jgi:hypothetical protein
MDPEHFGMSIAYARTDPPSQLLKSHRTYRADIDPLPLLPIGAKALRSLIARYSDAGLSKFVLRPATPVTDWAQEVEWLTAAVLDLQT